MNYIDIISNICMILTAAIVVIFVESYRECKRFRLTKYEIGTDKLLSGTGLRIIMLADLHNSDYGNDNDDIVRLVREQKPDIIVLAGDMLVCRSGQEEACMKTADFIRRLSEVSDVYYGVGNHENGVINRTHNVGRLWEKYYDRLFTDCCNKIHFMKNESEVINHNGNKLILYGLNLDRDYYRRFVAKRLDGEAIKEYTGDADSCGYNILIAHNPDYFEKYEEWGADLVLSGHNHGGLVRIPKLGGIISPRLRLFPRYDYGLYVKNNCRMVLTNGMGAHSIKIRVNNIPEIVCIDISGSRN